MSFAACGLSLQGRAKNCENSAVRTGPVATSAGTAGRTTLSRALEARSEHLAERALAVGPEPGRRHGRRRPHAAAPREFERDRAAHRVAGHVRALDADLLEEPLHADRLSRRSTARCRRPATRRSPAGRSRSTSRPAPASASSTGSQTCQRLPTPWIRTSGSPLPAAFVVEAHAPQPTTARRSGPTSCAARCRPGSPRAGSAATPTTLTIGSWLGRDRLDRIQIGSVSSLPAVNVVTITSSNDSANASSAPATSAERIWGSVT